ELREQPHTLRLAGFSVGEKPERAVLVQWRSRHSHQQRVGISDEARQRRHPQSLPRRDDLRLAIRGPERNLRRANLTLARPGGDAVLADDNPTDAIGRTGAPRSKQVA